MQQRTLEHITSLIAVEPVIADSPARDIAALDRSVGPGQGNEGCGQRRGMPAARLLAQGSYLERWHASLAGHLGLGQPPGQGCHPGQSAEARRDRGRECRACTGIVGKGPPGATKYLDSATAQHRVGDEVPRHVGHAVVIDGHTVGGERISRDIADELGAGGRQAAKVVPDGDT